MRAALIYQHANRERDRKIADGLSEQIKTARRSAAGRGDTLGQVFLLVSRWWRRGESNP